MPPLKKTPQTEAIFANLNVAHGRARGDATVLRLSVDAKTAVSLGPFSRGGYNRAGIRGVDHDFKPTGRLIPFGLFLPHEKALTLWLARSAVTSDFIADRLAEWWGRHRDDYRGVRTLLVDLDNGPENCGTRSQFLYRMVRFAQAEQVSVQLAYYPPYHSKYNPIGRCWGVLENHWRGEILDSVEAVLGFARSMTYAKHHPEVELVETAYPKGVRRTAAQKRRTEQHLRRTAEIAKWAILIEPPKVDQPIT